MTVLPVIVRELRVRARGRAAYWSRMAVAFIGALLCVQQLIVSGPLGTPAATGRHVFNEMVGAAFLLSCGACLLATEAIGSERRQGTLGLLFLTRLRGPDVVAGKLVSVGATSVYALAGLLPALMIPVLAGGVTGGEAFRKAAGLLATLLFALGAGLLGAAVQAHRLKAACGAVLVVLLTALVPLIFLNYAKGGIWHYAGWLSPLVLMVAAGDVSYQTAPGFYWGALATVQALGWLLLVGAGLLLQRSISRDGGAEVVRPPPALAKLEREVGLGRWRPAKAEAGPIEWLVYRQHGVNLIAWSLAVLALALSRWVSLASKPVTGAWAPPFWLLMWPLGLAAAAVGGALVAWTAGRFFASVRRTGELELLLPTPVGAKTILSDQWRVLQRFFVWPVLCLQVGTLVPVIGMTGARSAGLSSAWPLESVLAAFLSFANTFLGTAALCWLGLWFGLTARRQIIGVFYAVGLAQGVPWLVSLLVLILSAAGGGPSARAVPIPYAIISWLPEAVVLVFNLALLTWAGRGLAGRLAAADQSSFGLGWFIPPGARAALTNFATERRWTPS